MDAHDDHTLPIEQPRPRYRPHRSRRHGDDIPPSTHEHGLSLRHVLEQLQGPHLDLAVGGRRADREIPGRPIHATLGTVAYLGSGGVFCTTDLWLHATTHLEIFRRLL